MRVWWALRWTRKGSDCFKTAKAPAFARAKHKAQTGSRTSKNDKKSSDSDGAQNKEKSGNDSCTSQNDDRQGSEPDAARPTEKAPDIPENTRERDNAEVNFNDL